MNALHGQRRTLEGALAHHEEAQDELSGSSSAIQRMLRRLMVKRALYMGVALLLVLAIVLTWWLKTQWSTSSSGHGNEH